MPPILEISHLEKQFADFTAVKDMSFTVEEGSFFSILGPSGCGKTTLLRMIAGFLEPSAGSIKIRGQEMVGIPPNLRPVNLVFQNLALFPMMNVKENIAFGLKRLRLPQAEIDHKVESMLARVHLEGYGDKQVTQLSGGQKQRVAIARSLVLEPSILLLDEPLGALDLKLREQMKIELKKLQQEIGTTFIYITHDQSEALVMSDHVAVMNQGAFEQVDTPKRLYANPQSGFVASFVGETNRFEVTVTKEHDRIHAALEGEKPWYIESVDGTEEGPGTLYVRPESIILTPDETMEGLNRFAIEVKNILFDGSNTKILATMQHTGQEIMIALPQNKHFEHIVPGVKVEAGVQQEACKLYRREG